MARNNRVSEKNLKRAVMILDQCQSGQRAIRMTIRLGGYETYEIRDGFEAINLGSTIPEKFHCLVFSGVRSFRQVEQELDHLETYGFKLPVLLLGQVSHESAVKDRPAQERPGLLLRSCTSDRLLETLGELERDETPGQR